MSTAGMQRTEAKGAKGTKLLAGAAVSASYNMVFQLLMRVLTFGLNAFVLRYISKDMLGVVNVRLTLLYTTTMFLSTEAFDKACLSNTGTRDWRQTINLIWCTLPMSVLCCSVLGCVWLYMFELPDPAIISHYSYGVFSFALSTVVLVLSRPFFVVGQICLFPRLKVLVTGVSEIVRCLLTVFLVVCFPHWGLISFALAQVLYTFVFSMTYYLYFTYYLWSREKKDDDFPMNSMKDFFPRAPPNKPMIDSNQATLTTSIFKQCFLKQLLTEGEKYVMTIFGVLSFADQGIYDVINNLGSMAARFIFMPIEEAGYLFFSQLLTRGVGIQQQKEESVKLATNVLCCLLKIVSLIGVIILVFGYAYSYLALDLYGGAILSSGSGPMLLQWYCLYVLIIAINGSTECFFFATMSKQEVDRYNHKMLIFSALFLVSSLFLTRHLGSVGFIIANCLNMLARIIHSIHFIINYFKDSSYHPLKGVLPSKAVIFTLFLSLVVTVMSEKIFCCNFGILYRLLHICIGGLCLLIVLIVIYLTETDTINFIKEQYIESRRHKHEKTE